MSKVVNCRLGYAIISAFSPKKVNFIGKRKEKQNARVLGDGRGDGARLCAVSYSQEVIERRSSWSAGLLIQSLLRLLA